MKRAAAGVTEPGMKRVRNGDTELVITEEVMERVTERVMDRAMDRMERMMGPVMQEITRLIETLSKQSAPADCDVNQRLVPVSARGLSFWGYLSAVVL